MTNFHSARISEARSLAAGPVSAPRAKGLAIDSSGHRVRLKWHRLRRQRDDVAFTPRRLIEGLALGASMEVDLRAHADHGFVCLHDDRLDHETTGTGPVASASAEFLRSLAMRREDGRATADPLILLEDLAELARGNAASGALIQLDLKEEATGFNSAAAEGFRRTVASIAQSCILSGGDWNAVSRLAEGVPGLRLGFDPCTDDTLGQLTSEADCAHFVGDALATAPEADMIYLEYEIVLAATRLGVDLVAAFHASGKTVDAWTLNTDAPRAAEQLSALVALQVDQITTDEPQALEALFLGISRNNPAAAGI